MARDSRRGRIAHGARPMIVVWRVTERCNLACPFCAYDRRVARGRREADAGEVLRVAAVLRDYRTATGERVLVSWLGGEPLLWPPVFAVSERLAWEFGLEVSATTNGTALASPEARRRIGRDFAELTVSVDGFGKLHERMRGWRDGWTTLRDAVAALAAARRRRSGGPRLRANVVLMRDNVRDFAALCLELAGWGLDEITFNQLGGRDRPEFFPAHGLSADDVERVGATLPALRERLRLRGVRLRGSGAYLDRLRASARGEALAVADCRPGERFLFIDERGLVAPCSFTTAGYGVPLAEITSADALRTLGARFVAARTRQPAAACADCLSTQVFSKFG